MKIQNRKSKFTKSKPAKVPPKKTGAESAATAPEAEALSPLIEVPDPKAFLEEAKKESKRKLISDYSDTITVLRNEKRFTFRAIADWLTERGIEADHSSVYRAYLAAIPEENRDPRDPPEVWDEVDTPE